MSIIIFYKFFFHNIIFITLPVL